MRKINTNELKEETWSPPKGKFVGASKEVSEALGRKPQSTDLNEPHQLINDGTKDLILYVVADNPLGESVYYPDRGKWGVRSPERRILRSEGLDYYDGEE